MQTEFGVRFIVTGACQNTQANFSPLSICNRRSVRLLFLGLRKLLLLIRPEKYNMDVPKIMSFVLVPHMPRLDAMVAKLFLCRRKVSNFIYFSLFFYYH